MRFHSLPVLALPALSFLATPLGAQTLDDARLRVETYFSPLVRPVCMSFVGDRDVLVFANATGKVFHIKDGLPVNESLDLDVSFQGARGIIADPDFDQNGFVYLYYCASNTGDGGAWVESRVMRYFFDGLNLVNPVGPLFTVPFDAGQANPNAYNAGLLRFGPDGMLYGQVGDKARGRLTNPRVESNTGTGASSLAGAIFRIATDGSIPANNPFVGESDASLHPWYAYGFRNSLGMDFDPVSGDLWFSDNSPGDYDELNRGTSGMNSGWLLIMGPDARDIAYSYNNNTAYDAGDLVYLGGSFYRDPEFSFKDAIGITTVQFISSKRFPEDLQNDLIVSCTNTGELYGFEPTAGRDALTLTGGLADKVADDASERDSLSIGSGFGEVTDMILGPDGYLYGVSITNGAIYRLRPVVDLVEPATIEVVRGTLTSGSAAELERSDDSYATLQSGRPGALRRSLTLETTHVLNDASPTRLDLVVEARSNASGRQELRLWHVPSASWTTLDGSALTAGDSVTTVAAVPAPADYVNPTTKTVRLRIVHRAPAHPRAGKKARNVAPVISRFDQVRLLATLP